MEPEITGLEEVIIKYELDMEQGQRDLDDDHERMQQYEEEIEELRMEI